MLVDNPSQTDRQTDTLNDNASLHYRDGVIRIDQFCTEIRRINLLQFVAHSLLRALQSSEKHPTVQSKMYLLHLWELMGACLTMKCDKKNAEREKTTL